MYYEEKIVHGVLMSRSKPDGDWTVVTYDMLLAKYLSKKAEIVQMRAAANAEYEARQRDNINANDIANEIIGLHFGQGVL